ncbi:MAG TPA: hypothetical protein ENK39_00220 [Epsilonproteobacteria bacterium]|nr:hypothetical protein [Campylobacterota bacterium]
MKKHVIQFLLLFSLFFNIAHASIIATEDTCHHETAHEYVSEQAHATDCGDLCELHHLFHFMAIISNVAIHFDVKHTKTLLTEKPTLYTPPFKKTSMKPPIA